MLYSLLKQTLKKKANKRPNANVFQSAFSLNSPQAIITGKLHCSILIPAHFVNIFYFHTSFWPSGSSLIRSLFFCFTIWGWWFAATQLAKKVKSWDHLTEHSESSQTIYSFVSVFKYAESKLALIRILGKHPSVWISCNTPVRDSLVLIWDSQKQQQTVVPLTIFNLSA